MNRAICPGTFDPVTCGHLDIIERAATLFDDVVVGVALSPDKQGRGPVFSHQEREGFLIAATRHIPNVSVRAFGGLLIDFAEEVDAKVIVKGLRAVSDFESEFQMAQLNHRLDAKVETMFIMAIPEYTYLSSSAVKEIAALGGDVRGLVPNAVADVLAARLAQAR